MNGRDVRHYAGERAIINLAIDYMAWGNSRPALLSLPPYDIRYSDTAMTGVTKNPIGWKVCYRLKRVSNRSQIMHGRATLFTTTNTTQILKSLILHLKPLVTTTSILRSSIVAYALRIVILSAAAGARLFYL